MKPSPVGRQALVLNPLDNVAVAIVDLPAGSTVELESAEGRRAITLLGPINFGHKFAIRPIGQAEPVIKYGQRIGRTTAPIQPGEHVHVHNIEAERARGDLARAGQRPEPPGRAKRTIGLRRT